MRRKTTYASQSHSSRSRRLSPLTFPSLLLYRYTSRLAPLDNVYRHKATTRHPYDTPSLPSLFFVAYTLSIQFPSPAPPRAALPYKT
ncbi:hypothetical protein BGY98DRAFT_68312 [Russula aff. rugulosa BPL654]|nr:hypothetical protein BGY98DRAFT_68312 [Russula aff. rugulosa BPL654]